MRFSYTMSNASSAFFVPYAHSQLHINLPKHFPETSLLNSTYLWSRFTKTTLFCDQALDLLVSVSSMHCCTYTPDLSTLLSSRSLTVFRHGISYLEAGFTLRCFQRLSAPHFATRQCRWRDNRYTIGAFIPVLSY